VGFVGVVRGAAGEVDLVDEGCLGGRVVSVGGGGF